MQWIPKAVLIFAMFAVLGCRNSVKSAKNLKQVKRAEKRGGSTENPMVRYTNNQLEAFLDSVGNLPTKQFADKAAFGADSVFRSPLQLDTIVSAADMKILKGSIPKGVIPAKVARRIFNNNLICDSCNSKGVFLTFKVGLTPVIYYPFNVGKNEYGVCIGDPNNCQNAYLYFFKGDKILARHRIYTRHGQELKWFADQEGESVIYYTNEFDEGSGIWWFNYFFYKYDGDGVKPALNIPQNINLLQPSPWGLREVWLECIIKKQVR